MTDISKIQLILDHFDGTIIEVATPKGTIMTATKSAIQVFEQVQEAAKANEANLRFIKEITIGQGVRQGDVSLYRIQDLDKSKMAKLKPWQHGLQLAEGSTRGSRHCLAEDSKVVAYAPPERSEATVGPIVTCPERFTVTHPDHAHFSLPAGSYQVTYHKDLSTLDRVHD